MNKLPLPGMFFTVPKHQLSGMVLGCGDCIVSSHCRCLNKEKKRDKYAPVASIEMKHF